MVIIILLLLLIVIVLLHFLYKGTSLIENLDDMGNSDDSGTSNTGPDNYQPYNDLVQNPQKGPMFLAMKNAANISALHSQLTALKTVPYEISDLSGQVHTNSKALVNIGKQIQSVGEASLNTNISSGPYPSTSSVSNTSSNSNSTAFLTSNTPGDNTSSTSWMTPATSTPATSTLASSTPSLATSSATSSTTPPSTPSSSTQQSSGQGWTFAKLKNQGGW